MAPRSRKNASPRRVNQFADKGSIDRSSFAPDKVPCGCGGENSNCFKCDGTGLYEPELFQPARPDPNALKAAQAVLQRSKVAAGNKSQKALQAAKKRPSGKLAAVTTKAQADSIQRPPRVKPKDKDCLESKRPSRQGTPTVAHARPDSKDQSPTPQAFAGNTKHTWVGKGQPQLALDRCRLCMAILRAHEFAAHMASEHRGGRHEQARGSGAVAKEGSGDLRRCPVCACPVSEKRLQTHVRKVHPRFIGGAAPPGNAGKSLGRYSLGEAFVLAMGKDRGRSGKFQFKDGSMSGGNSAQHESGGFRHDAWPGSTPDERRQDATKDYGHSFRENGRYGSHASHDDYGDESGAD